jgi:DNA-binding response OmpR family regulator
MSKRILIIEDEQALAALLSDYLSVDGFAVEARADGPSGLQAALAGGFDLVLLDLMLPGLDGFEVCRALRAQDDVPVLILSARREDGDKIRGLGLGADDYIVKPFSPAELVARVKSHLARYERLTGRASADRWITDGGLEVNMEARRVRRNGAEVALTAKEFDLLILLIRNPDRAFTREEIHSRIWGDDLYVDPANIAVHVRRLREKIEDDPSQPRRIETVWGVGYRWKPSPP